MKKYSKDEAASLVVNCALQYQKELVNKSLVFLCLNRSNRVIPFEVSFREKNFMHLTGLKPVKFIDSNSGQHILSAPEFYNKCISKTITTSMFEFANDGTTDLKLEILPRVICKNLSANMIGNYDTYSPKLQTDKLVGKQSGIVGFVLDEDENKYLPNTLLNADIRDYSKSTLRIIATFRKNITDDKYQELTYKAKKVEWEKLKFPEQYEYLATLL